LTARAHRGIDEIETDDLRPAGTPRRFFLIHVAADRAAILRQVHGRNTSYEPTHCYFVVKNNGTSLEPCISVWLRAQFGSRPLVHSMGQLQQTGGIAARTMTGKKIVRPIRRAHA
jgi:hypothetical protein